MRYSQRIEGKSEHAAKAKRRFILSVIHMLKSGIQHQIPRPGSKAAVMKVHYELEGAS